MSSSAFSERLVRVDRPQLLNNLLAVTETDKHLVDAVTHGSLQVRLGHDSDKLRNRMATLRGCVRRATVCPPKTDSERASQPEEEQVASRVSYVWSRDHT
jgi:hypothetical protein